MIRLCALLIVTLLVSVRACVETPHFGGDKERALAAAALAVDVSAVTRGLASGADPNKMVDVNGRWQSPWFLALYQLRSSSARHGGHHQGHVEGGCGSGQGMGDRRRGR